MKKNRLRRSKTQFSKTLGMAPGSLIYVGNMDSDISKLPKPTVTLTSYDAAEFTETVLSDDDLAAFDLSPFTKAGKKVWINIHGVHDAELIAQIGTLFDLHPLVQEDI